MSLKNHKWLTGDVDLVNFCALLLLESEGNYCPSQSEIEAVEALLQTKCIAKALQSNILKLSSLSDQIYSNEEAAKRKKSLKHSLDLIEQAFSLQ